jgi:hypothetical protein
MNSEEHAETFFGKTLSPQHIYNMFSRASSNVHVVSSASHTKRQKELTISICKKRRRNTTSEQLVPLQAINHNKLSTFLF